MQKLEFLEEWNRSRFLAACKYSEGLEGLTSVMAPHFDISLPQNHVFHLFVVQCERRNQLQQFLTGRGIQTGIHYLTPIHRQKAFASWGYPEGTCPVAESLSGKILSLPMFPEITDVQIETVIKTIKEF